MRTDAAEWVPLFPKEEIPFILAAVLRSGAQLKKLHGTELENDLSDRLRDELDRDSGLRDRPIEIFREVPLYDRQRARRRQLGRTDLMFLYSTGVNKPWPYFGIESKRLHVSFPSGWQRVLRKFSQQADYSVVEVNKGGLARGLGRIQNFRVASAGEELLADDGHARAAALCFSVYSRRFHQ